MTMIDTDATCNAHDDDDEGDADDDDDDDQDDEDKLFPLQDLISKRCFRYLHPFPPKKCPLKARVLSTCSCFRVPTAGGA